MRVPLVTPATRYLPTEGPMLIPVHYLTPDTMTAPFVMLTDGADIGSPTTLPLAIGVWPVTERTSLGCDDGPECVSREHGYPSPLLYRVEDSASGGGMRVWCLPCLICMDPVSPAIRVEWVPFE